MYGDLPEIKTKNQDGTESVIHAFPIHIPFPSKIAALRLPTSEEMLDYMRKQKSEYRYLGRGKGRSKSLPNPRSDRDLFDRLRIDNDQEAQEGGKNWFDDDECGHAISILTQQRIFSRTREGDNYTIVLRTMLGDTTHTLHPPFMKDMAEYRRNAYVSTDMGHNLEHRQFPPEPSCTLYDACILKSEGYSSGTEVPPHHKQAIALELVAAVSELDPSLDPND